jgi:hypothetical protein
MIVWLETCFYFGLEVEVVDIFESVDIDENGVNVVEIDNDEVFVYFEYFGIFVVVVLFLKILEILEILETLET